MRLTKQQVVLKALHGDLDEFTDACIDAIGTITKAEALKAIRRYRKEWREAGWVRQGPKEVPDASPSSDGADG